MTSRRDDWADVFQALGEAFFAVLRSEWEVLSRRWQESLRSVLFAAAFLAVAALLAILLLALLVTAAVLLVEDAFGWKAWQATLFVAGLVLAVIMTLAAVAWFGYLRRFENPMASARERLDDHLQWWRERLLEGERLLPEGEKHGESDDETPAVETPAGGSGPAE